MRSPTGSPTGCTPARWAPRRAGWPGSPSPCTSRTSPGPATSGRCDGARGLAARAPRRPAGRHRRPGPPSGGNAYDRRVCPGWRRSAGRCASTRCRGPGRPRPTATAPRWPRLLAAVPDDGLVLLDGLVASAAPDVLAPRGAAAAPGAAGPPAAGHRRRGGGAGRRPRGRHHQRVDPAAGCRPRSPPPGVDPAALAAPSPGRRAAALRRGGHPAQGPRPCWPTRSRPCPSRGPARTSAR